MRKIFLGSHPKFCYSDEYGAGFLNTIPAENFPPEGRKRPFLGGKRNNH
jgi:hypothetical protein